MAFQDISVHHFIQDYTIRSIACCFSGGKDSLVATHFMLSQIEGLPIAKHVVYADTGIMLPIAGDFVRDVCRSFGWNLTIVDGYFFEKAKKNGMPRMRHRWCCYTCKVEPMQKFIRTLPPQRAEVTGLRRDESNKRAQLNQIYYKRRVPSWAYAPIIGWTEKQVLSYIRKNGLPMPPHYKLGLHETCMCGVYSNRKQMEILKAQFPELWQKILDLEASFRTHGAAFYFNNKPVRASTIDEQKILFEEAKEAHS
jgi:3'-phosphoadenosine 5'-phosphosulfate sulfotransferase (PAPS reductase)/FAD synthetase